jgi:adenylate cyclase
VFAKTVSPNVVQELLKAERLSLVGARRRITVLFADVRGFTEITDQHQARAEEHVRRCGLDAAAAERYYDEQAARWLDTVNRYLGLIADVVKRHDGTLDKYIGDCVMAFWGAPAGLERHAARTVRAAIEIQQSVAELNQRRRAQSQQREVENAARGARGEDLLPPLDLLEVGTGINTGTVTVGLMGSDEHIMNYTVFGREVNVASRLEGVSGHSRIIIGEGTYRDLLHEAPALATRCRELEPVHVKGIRAPVKIYEMPWQDGTATTAPAPDPGRPHSGLSAA